jgi:hypothetical protein
LALYTELDFQASDSEAILSNPVTLHAQMVEFDRRTIETTLRHAREMAVLEYDTISGHGLLHLLFLDARQADRAFYLAGYLWVKAVAALIARRCPAFAPPARMLPLLVRLLCDHPAISDALDGRCDAAALVQTIHDSVMSLSAEQLQNIATMIETQPEAVEWFDLWDIHGQIASGQFSHVVRSYESEYDRYFGSTIGTPLERDLLLARGAAQIHLLSTTRGTVLQVSEDGNELRLNTGSGVQSVHLLPIENFWSLAAQAARGRRADIEENIERFLPVAMRLQEEFRSVLRKSIGQPITLANYMCLPAPNSYGLVLWQDWSSDLHKRVVFPVDWMAYDDDSEMPIQETLSAGTVMSPEERRTLAHAIKGLAPPCISYRRGDPGAVRTADWRSPPASIGRDSALRLAAGASR